MASGDYSKVGPWVNGAAPALSAANLDTVETQFEEAAYIPTARQIPPIVRWVAPGWVIADDSPIAVTANRIYYMPIYVPESVTYDRIGIFVTVGDGAGGLADLRIFNWDTGVPGSLVLSAGTVNTNAAGAKEIVINQALNGLYFLSLRDDQTPTIAGVQASTGFVAPVSGHYTSNNQNWLMDNLISYDDAAYADPAGVVDGAVDMRHAFLRLREA